MSAETWQDDALRNERREKRRLDWSGLGGMVRCEAAVKHSLGSFLYKMGERVARPEAHHCPGRPCRRCARRYLQEVAQKEEGSE